VEMFDYTLADIQRAALTCDADVVGITAVTGTHLTAMECARLFKARPKPPIVILGGAHATQLDEQVALRWPVDYVVRGEGEETLLEIVSASPKGSR